MTALKGIAWNHSRGFVSVVATAQRYEELHPEVSISWEKRSLQAFADASMAELAARYDLIVMDHPHTALAAMEGLLLPYEEWLSAEFLADQAANSVGQSNASYRFHDCQWTLATDAATPVATWRPDLLARDGFVLPTTWEEVLELARAGRVSVPAFPVDLLMYLYMFCDALGHPPLGGAPELAPEEVVIKALEEIRRLTQLCDEKCFARNPIRVAEFMTSSNELSASYCPFGYGYSNYSRPGYADHVLKAGGLVHYGQQRLRSTLGGAGLAVSSHTRHPEIATNYAAFTASPSIQRGLYFQAGGQPGHRSAWTNDAVNAASGDFFRATLATLDEAIVRPQHPEYMRFQDLASPLVSAAIQGQASLPETARQLNQLFHAMTVS